MNFFFDNMMSPKLPRMLSIFFGHAQGHQLTHLREMFPDNATDAQWIGALCGREEPWAILTGDARMLGRLEIVTDLHQSNNVFFCMDGAWCNANNGHEQAWKLLKLWPDIVAHSRTPGPAFFDVRMGGALKVEAATVGRRARMDRLMRRKRGEPDPPPQLGV